MKTRIVRKEFTPQHLKAHPECNNSKYLEFTVTGKKYGYQLQQPIGPKEELRVLTIWLELDDAKKIQQMLTCPQCGHVLTGKKREALIFSVIEKLI